MLNYQKTHKPSIKPLDVLVKQDLEDVGTLITQKLGSDVAAIPEVAEYLISSGGKRIRPMLTLASANMCGYKDGFSHILLAASIEFMHTATLLHDDVVDDSDIRRGKLAARMLWGNKTSVLVGDFLLGQAFRMMIESHSLEALDVLSKASVIIAEGEVMQLVATENLNTSLDDYFSIIRSKTAALFSAACHVGPIIAQCDQKTCEALRAFGENLGMGFQIIDDALDYTGFTAVLGKQEGNDFKEAKITLPVIYAFANGSDKDRVFFERTFTKRDICEGDFEEAVRIIKKTRALDETFRYASQFCEAAKVALSDFEDNPYKEALIEVVDYCLARES